MPVRRGVGAGALASYAAGAVNKAGSIALGQIPVPLVGSLIDKAWSKADEAVRSKLHRQHVAAPVNAEEKVKFQRRSPAATWPARITTVGRSRTR